MTSLLRWNAAMSMLTAFAPRARRLGTVALGLSATLLAPAFALAQATSPTTINVTGGAQPASQTAPTGQVQFGLRVPLKPNAENVLTLTAADATGQTVTVDNLKIAQITLTDVVRAQVTATRLSTPEVRELVAQGVIDIADPANYNVSRFVVVLTVGTQQVEVPVPVVRRIEEPFAEGEPVQIGCGSSLSTSGNRISVPCGNDGGNPNVRDIPPIQVVPFEVAPPAPGLPSIPGVIIIEGRIKTLKEFFKVNLLLMNVSSIFTLTDLTARLDVPADALTPVAPAGGSIALPDIGPGGETTGNFIVRGDTKGTHTVTAYFGGSIVGSFLPGPVPFSGSASTDLEVKGPPKLDVRVSHPDFVVAGQPYDLTVTIENTDPELDALYASMALDVGAGADLLDETSGQRIDGPVTRSLGDILKGQSITQTYKVMPLVTGGIISCVGAADANINLSVAFVGNGPGCAIGTLPSARLNPDGKPTVTVVPAHATADVNPATAIVALFSDPMIQPTITAGYAGAAFTVSDAAGAVVGGTLSFADIFGGTSAIFQPTARLAPETEYTITVSPSVFNTAGLSLASGIVARFTTSAATATPDTTAPTVSLAVEPPLTASAIPRGQSVPIAAQAADARGVTRVDLLLDGELIDAKKGSPSLRFLVETLDLTPGSSHVVQARAFDLAGNVGTATVTVQIAPDLQAPVVAIVANSAVGQGQVLPVLVQATDDGRVARVELFLDGGTAPIATGLVGPFQFSVDTTGLTGASHQLRAVAEDGAGNQSQATASFTITADSTPPQLAIVSPQGTRFRAGSPVPFAAQASDNTGVAAVTYTLDAETTPRGTGDSFTLDTTGLALGAHVMAVVASDASNNRTTLPVAFELTTLPVDTTPPPAVVVNALTLSTVAGGIVGVTGAAGAAEARARVVFTNQRTQAGATAVASATGTFSVQIEAAGGDLVAIVAIDEAGNTSPAVTVTVPVPASLVSIAVTPTAVTLSRSRTSEPLGVVGTFSDNTQQVLTSGLTFTSSAPSVATVTPSGVVLPGVNGAAVVTVAAATGVAPVLVPVTVNFATVVGLSASPSPLALVGLGRSQRLAVSARYSDNSTGAFGGTVRFATANPNVAVVDGTGLVTSTGIGSTTVTAAATGLPSVPVLVTVSAVQPTDIVVTPTSGSFTTLGQTLQLAVQYRFSDGTTGSAPFPVTYQSLDAAVVTVSPAGLVTAAGEGTTTVVVRSQGFTASVPMAVTLPTTLPPPVITSLGRPVAGHGDTLAILGSNFSGVPLQNFVTVNGVRASVTSAASERLIVLVPEGAATGPVQVRVGGQTSNAVQVQIYARGARAVLESAPFSTTPGPGGSVGLGSTSVVVYPGDAVVVAGDPFAITGPQWTAVEAPTVIGTLVLTVNGSDVILTPSGQPIDVTSFLPPITQPTTVTLGLKVEAAGGLTSSRGLAIVVGPPATGVFVGERFTVGDGVDDQVTLRFRTNAPDGTRFAATAQNWYRPTGACCNNSAGGALAGGVPTPNDGNFRTYTASGGEVVVAFSDAPVVANFGAPVSSWVALVPADASGNRIGQTPVAEGQIRITALDSASVLPQQTSILADGVDRPFAVDINSVRDSSGNRVTDATRLAVTAVNWYRRSDGGCCNGSAGGSVVGGVATPNDGNFRTVTLASGAAQVVYAAGSVTLPAGSVDTAVLAVTMADTSNSRRTQTPLAEGSIVRSAPSSTLTSIVAVPSTLSAVGADNRSVITLTGLVDALGRPVPDGSRVAVTTVNWYRQSDGGCCNSSFGGTIVGGDAVPNDGNFRSFVVNGGTVSFTYSNAGLVLDRGASATAVVAVLPAAGNGSRIGQTPFAEVRIVQGGLTSATIVATPASTLADGARRPVAVAITNLRDALGNVVPDGTKIALTAVNWYRRGDSGCCNNSAGGIFLDGVSTPNDGNFRTYTVTNGRVDATYSAETVTLLSPNDSRSAVISATVANAADNRVTQTPFAEGTVALSSAVAASAVASPPTLYADRQGRTSVVTISGITDAQGVPVPDGTKVAVTAASWYRMSDGGCCNGSAGGTLLGGEATPNDGSFRTYTVAGGQVTATYSNAGLFIDTANTASAVLSVLPATPAANRIGTLPMAAVSVSLVGPDTGTFVGATTVAPSGSLSLMLTNLRDAAGNLIPDGARVAFTVGNWYNRDGSFGNGSAGGALSGGVPTPNDGNFRTATVSGGQATLTFTAPATANVTSVVSVLSADGAGNRNALRPFATLAVRVQ